MPPELQIIIDRNPWINKITRFDTVYLAGPMSGLPNLNRDHFHQWEHLIKINGAKVLSPAHADQTRIYSLLIRDGLSMVLSSNVTVMLAGWKQSNGANQEWTISTLINNRIYYETEG
jgi:hypothetical protein